MSTAEWLVFGMLLLVGFIIGVGLVEAIKRHRRKRAPLRRVEDGLYESQRGRR